MKKCILYMILILSSIFMLGCSVESEASYKDNNEITYDWNEGYCPKDNTRYSYIKSSTEWHYYECPECGEIIKFSQFQIYTKETDE